VLAVYSLTYQEQSVVLSPHQELINAMRSQASEQPAQPSLEFFIQGRMEIHCRMVDNFGFGSFKEVRDTIEDVMTEIWVTTLEKMEAPNNSHSLAL
jgi:hypothetical protein